MPFWTPYESVIEPDMADLDNAPGFGFAGSITAALFLRRFVTDSPAYAHFDIYGWQPTAAPARPKGGVGQGAGRCLKPCRKCSGYERPATDTSQWACGASVVKGTVKAARFVEGTWARLAVPLADFLRRPDGPRDRQVILGDRLLVLEQSDRHAFVQAEKDGYCGYVAETALGPDQTVTHWVSAPASHLYATPSIKLREIASLTLGAQVRIVARTRPLCRNRRWAVRAARPSASLRAVAGRPGQCGRGFLGTPYCGRQFAGGAGLFRSGAGGISGLWPALPG